jgi:hypothetical protein
MTMLGLVNNNSTILLALELVNKHLHAYKGYANTVLLYYIYFNYKSHVPQIPLSGILLVIYTFSSIFMQQ